MSKKGFTLIELLVVIAIIGILAVLIIVALGRARASARNQARKSVLNSIAQAEEMYNDQTGGYATGAAAFTTLGSYLTNPNSPANPAGTAYTIGTHGTGGFCALATGWELAFAGFYCSENGCGDGAACP